ASLACTSGSQGAPTRSPRTRAYRVTRSSSRRTRSSCSSTSPASPRTRAARGRTRRSSAICSASRTGPRGSTSSSRSHDRRPEPPRARAAASDRAASRAAGAAAGPARAVPGRARGPVRDAGGARAVSRARIRRPHSRPRDAALARRRHRCDRHDLRGGRARRGHGDRGRARGRVRARAPARPPRPARPRDGLLHLRQRRGRGARRAARARDRARRDRRLRRPPRQRDGRDLPRRRQRPRRLAAPVAVLSRQRRPRRPGRDDAEHPACRGLRRRRVPAGVRAARRAGGRGLRPRARARVGRLRRARRDGGDGGRLPGALAALRRARAACRCSARGRVPARDAAGPRRGRARGLRGLRTKQKGPSGPFCLPAIVPTGLPGREARCLLRASAAAESGGCPAVGERHPPRRGISGLRGPRDGEVLERLAARGDAELAQEALHVRADGVLRDEEALRDLVRAEVVVEQEQHLDLAGRERVRDRVRDAGAAAVAASHLVEQPPGDGAREGGLAVRDALEERRDPLGRLGLQQVAGGAGADRLQEVLLGAGRREDDDLALRGRLAQPRQRREPVEAGHREVEQDEVRLKPPRLDDRLRPVRGDADDVQAVGAQERRERLAREGMVVDDEDPAGHSYPLSAASLLPTSRNVTKDLRSDLQSWLWGEILLAGLLGASLALFLAYPALRTHWDLPELRIVLQTAMAGAGLLVAVLAAARYSAEGRRVDLFLASGFFITSLSSAVFAIGPYLGGGRVHPPEAWSSLIGAILGQALIALAPFSRGRSKYREWSIANAV